MDASSDKKWILIPQNLNRTLQKGIIKVKEKEFFVTFQLKSSMDLKDASFRCDWELKALLYGYEEALKQRMMQCKSVGEFLNEIHCLATTLLTERDRRTEARKPNLPTSFIENMVAEIEKIGWERLHNLDPSFMKMSLIAHDSSSRQHILNITFNNEDPTERPIFQTDLPCSFNPKWSTKDHSLLSLYQQFVQELDQYKDFWNIIDELDEHCWILEPEGRSRGSDYRRIALSNNSSVLININPKQPRSFPECRFIGADHVIVPLREKLNANLLHWDHDNSLLENLEALLEMKLPSAEQANSQESCMDCSICYAYRFNDEIPEKTCDDPRCCKNFHTSCLVEWLRSLPNFRQSFNVLFGECPHCSKPLTVKMGPKRQRTGTR